MTREQHIDELESAITANDEHLQKVEAENQHLRELNAELLTALKATHNDDEGCEELADAAIAKAEKLK